MGLIFSPRVILALVLAGLLAVIGALHIALQHQKTVIAQERAGWAQERANTAAAAASASEAYRAREQAWAASAAQIQSDGEKQREQIAADADRARKSAGSLRVALDAARALRHTAAASAPTSADCQAAATTGDLLSIMFSSAVDRAGELAAYADSAAAAGDACQRSYEALTH